MIHLVITGMKLNKDLIKNVYSPRIKLQYNNDLIEVLDRFSNEYVGFIKEIPNNNELTIEFDIENKFKNKGLQTEILREYLRYKYLWEKKCDLITCYPVLEQTKKVLLKRYFKNDNNKFYINKDIYMSHVEKLQLFDENLNRITYPNLRGEDIKPHTYAGIVDVIIRNNKNNKYLTTRRDLNKVTSPGLWEITGGGIDFGEDIEKALVREVKEETGLNIIDYTYLDTNKIKDLVYFTYLGIVDCNEDEVVLQKNETIDYKWRTKEELIELFNSNLVPPKQALRIKKIINKI